MLLNGKLLLDGGFDRCCDDFLMAGWQETEAVFDVRFVFVTRSLSILEARNNGRIFGGYFLEDLMVFVEQILGLSFFEVQAVMDLFHP